MSFQVQLLKETQQMGLEPLLDDLRNHKVAPDLAMQELDLAWWSSILTEILKSDSILAAVDDAAPHDMVSRFRPLDLAQIESLLYPVVCAVSLHTKQVLSSDPQLEQKLHPVLDPVSVRELGDYSCLVSLVKALRPIRVVSPLIAGQLYGTNTIDLLVLDYLDYLSVPQVMPLIAWVRQIVVCGDIRRVWPGFTQTAARILPTVALKSDLGEIPEQVTVFLATHGYENAVTPVPLSRPASLVNLHLAAEAKAPLSHDHTLVISRPEIHWVVELCLDHVLNRPQLNLAAVCFNPAAVGKIRKALADACVKIP